MYRIEPDGEALILSHDGELDLRFSLTPRRIEQYQPNSDYLQSHQTHFTRQPSCSMATPDGRITLSGMRVIETRDGARREWELEGEAARRAFLRDYLSPTGGPASGHVVHWDHANPLLC